MSTSEPVDPAEEPVAEPGPEPGEAPLDTGPAEETEAAEEPEEQE